MPMGVGWQHSAFGGQKRIGNDEMVNIAHAPLQMYRAKQSEPKYVDCSGRRRAISLFN